jgi:hypothetical protein
VSAGHKALCTALTSSCLVFFFFFFESGSYSKAQTGLELELLLPHPPVCWDHRHATLYPAFSWLACGLSSSKVMSRVGPQSGGLGAGDCEGHQGFRRGEFLWDWLGCLPQE